MNLNQALMLSAVGIASSECDKNLQWTGLDCEAEKYLAPLREVLGVSTARFEWCAAFVTWCIRTAGYELPYQFMGPDKPTVAYVPEWEEWARNCGYWHDASDPDFVCGRGDIVLFDWDGHGTDGDDDHIGLVEHNNGEKDADGNGFIHTCEGNTSAPGKTNGNSTAHKTRNFLTIHGFIRFPV